MEISVSNQAYVFLGMVLCGALCSLAFDIFRGIRRIRNPGTGVIVMQDLLLWFTEIVIVYMCAFKLNYAGIRAYELVALFIGSVIYFMTLSTYVIKLVGKIIVFIIKTVNFILFPIKKLLGFILKPLFSSAKKLCRIFKDFLSVFSEKLSLLKSVVKAKLLRAFKEKNKAQKIPSDCLETKGNPQ